MSSSSSTAGSTNRPMSDLQPAMRPISSNLDNLSKSGQQRPSSEVLAGHYKSPEAEAIDRWFEDLSYYERTLEQMAHAKLDDNFREELKAIEQWFSVLSDPERTTALYSLLQHTTQVQIRFFITVLQQMAQKDPVSASVAQPPGTGSGAVGVPPGVPVGAAGKVSINSTPGLSAVGKGVSTSGSVAPSLESDLVAEEENFLGLLPLAAGASPGPANPALRNTSRGRLYERHSAPNADEKYATLLGDMRTGDGGASTPGGSAATAGSVVGVVGVGGVVGVSSTVSSVSVLARPKTPVDDAIASANWSVGAGGPPGLAVSGVPPRYPIVNTSIAERSSSLIGTSSVAGTAGGGPGGVVAGSGSSVASGGAVSGGPGGPAGPGGPIAAAPGVGAGVSYQGSPVVTDAMLMGRSPYPRPLSPRPVSPIFVSPPSPSISVGGVGVNVAGTPALQNRQNYGHPGDGWGHISLGVGVHGGSLRAPGSPGTGTYAHSDYSDSYDEYGTEPGEQHDPSKSKNGTHKEKGKIPEAVDLEALNDIPSWLRSLRLHKYTGVFETANWRDMVRMSDEDLTAKGVSALGARRKLLKVFELIRAECQAKGIVI
ncbi:hypothetical protein HDU76_002564 [Blyttiomyces sp. JEL0837]|nr:hypothetical protein HDU76_002564 [Blyttiomyces sp. JEL0837]